MRAYESDLPFSLLIFSVVIAALFLTPKRSESVPAHHMHRVFVTHTKHQSSGSQEQLEAMVFARHPRRSRHYAHYIASLIAKNAHAAHLPMAAVAATACIESDFSMHSGPCLGMMQLNPRTVHERHADSGLDPHVLSDNIRLGVREMAYHYQHTNPHASVRRRLAVMWGHYNGAGANSHYVRHALRVYDALS